MLADNLADVLELFTVVNADFVSARVFALKPLVGRHANYAIRVRAEDRGAPPNVAHQDVAICVADFNDHAPQFASPEQNATVRIAENATIGALVTTVLAVDDDTGLNSQIRYSLRNDPLGHSRWFLIDEVTGDVTLALPLDREKQKVYDVIEVVRFQMRRP